MEKAWMVKTLDGRVSELMGAGQALELAKEIVRDGAIETAMIVNQAGKQVGAVNRIDHNEEF